MTRKHFETAAEILADARRRGESECLVDYAEKVLINLFETHNYRFDRGRFSKAAGNKNFGG